MTTCAGAHLFVVPEPNGLPTGGNLYNDGILLHLGELLNEPVERVELARAEAWLRAASPRVLWVDSLYLSALPALCACAAASRPMLIAHYLPSWVEHGDALSRDQLTRDERAALASVAGALAPSRTMAAMLRRLRPELRVHVAEPARERARQPEARSLGEAPDQGDPSLCRAVYVGNLVEGKGLLGLLEELVPRVRAGDRFELQVIGREDVDPVYAARCRALASEAPELRARVRFAGPLPHAQVLSELRRARVFVSSSRMESYGMAIAEARVAGLPVLARRGGHAGELVSQESGGALFADDAALADELLVLARDPKALRDRLAAAARSALAPRSFRDVAQEVASIARAVARSDQ